MREKIRSSAGCFETIKFQHYCHQSELCNPNYMERKSETEIERGRKKIITRDIVSQSQRGR